MTYRPWSHGRCILLNKTLTLLALVSAILLTACSEDSAQDDTTLVAVEAIPSSQSFVDVEPTSFTRAGTWTMPDGYVSYSTLNNLFADQTDLIDNTIDIFFTSDVAFTDEVTGQTVNYLQGLFMHSIEDNDDKWRSSVKINAESPYYLYGFIPYISSVNASIAPDGATGKYQDGAVLTLSGLPTVTPSDVCVVVGAKNGVQKNDQGQYVNHYKESGSYTIPGLAAGDFKYVSGPAVGSDGKGQNYVFLLFEHIYSAMQFRFNVGDTYAALRKIKLKKLELMAYDSNSNPKSRDVTATITLKANNTGTSPITDFSFAPFDARFDMDPVVIYANDNPTNYLPSGLDGNSQPIYSSFFGSFVPDAISYLELISTYDVYDTNDNLIRSNCTAKNSLSISKLFYGQDNTKRGWKYILNMTVEPTYLYVMSDPDLDNPTIRLKVETTP